jgi:hypothetical protein
MPAVMCTDASPLGGLDAPLRRLTNLEYRASVAALFGQGALDGVELLESRRPETFSTDVSNLGASATLIETLLDAAERIASAAMVNGSLARFDACAAGELTESCALAVLDRLAPRAYRRELTADEKTSLEQTFARGLAESGPALGLEIAIERMLLSPSFLFRLELGDETAPLTSFERAERISYVLEGAPPDDALRDAALAGAIETEEEIRAQVERLLYTEGEAGERQPSPQAREWLAQFHAEWLELDHLLPIPSREDPTLMLGPLFARETRAFVDEVVWRRNGGIEDLLGGGFAMVDATLAGHYGLPADGVGDELVAIPNDRNIGLLTQGSFLARTAAPTGTSPIQRGVFVLRRVWCGEIGAPPVGVPGLPPRTSPDASVREILAAHRADPTCATCHDRIDPAGLAFEDFGPWAQLREGHDATGGFGEIEGAPTVDGGRDASLALAANPDVQACYREHVFRYAFGRAPTAEEHCALSMIPGESTLEILTEVLVASMSEER